METGLLHLHNFIRWLFLIFGAWALYRAATGLGGRRPFASTDRKASLYLLIATHLQLVLGLVLYFTRGWASQLVNGGSGIMQNKALRFWTVEHGPGMLLAVALITIGYSAAKRGATDKSKFNRWFWYSLIGFIIVLVTIPWPNRELVGRGLFPGMSAQ